MRITSNHSNSLGFTLVEGVIVFAILFMLIMIPFATSSSNEFKIPYKKNKVVDPVSKESLEVYEAVSLGNNVYFIPSKYKLAASATESFRDNENNIEKINISLKNFLSKSEFKVLNIVFTNDGVYIITE